MRSSTAVITAVSWLLCISGAFSALEVLHHPLENRTAYVRGVQLPVTDTQLITELRELFTKHPLLVFQDAERDLDPKEFLEFLTIFDADCDTEAVWQPQKHPEQMLQPFDQLPGYEHVAPRGNFNRDEIYGIKNLEVKPTEPFIEGYVWHSDLIGHATKLPGVITGFFIKETPLLGGNTDFISGNTVYVHLPDDMKDAARNIVYEVNRMKFMYKDKAMDYSGTVKVADTVGKYAEHNVKIPLLYGPEPCVLLQASIFESVVGWSREDSDKWLAEFMHKHVLPHRFSVQWKKGDIGVFNNRKMMHSSTPAEQFLKYKGGSSRLLLQTFLPTKAPLQFVQPVPDDNMHARVGWVKDVSASQAATRAAHELYEQNTHAQTCANTSSDNWRH
jgi:alpha-ketoglutarate-dependent taurine dioxygenase